MTLLEPLVLDDLTWDDMTAAVRDRIAPESAGEWTLHAPVDPGITLLDLFAYLLEQRLYLMDQTPDSLVRAILRLLGSNLRPARAATTVLCITDLHGATHHDVVAGTELTLAGGELVLTTQQTIAALPAAIVEVSDGSHERSADLLARRPVPLLRADGGPAEATFGFETNVSLQGLAGAWVSFLLDVRAPARVLPQWLAGAVEVPPPAVLVWSYRGGPGGTSRRFGPDAIDDGTAGLRRPGVLRLKVPPSWEPDAPPSATGVHRYTFAVATDAATFTSRPVLTALEPNAVVAAHRRAESVPAAVLEQQIAGWLPLPGLELHVAPPASLLDEPGSTGLRLRERDGDWHDWEQAPDLTFAGPADRFFVVDREAGSLRFGDGYTGRIPVAAAADGAPRAEVTCELGGGTQGNFGSSLLWERRSGTYLRAFNRVPGEGGAEAESVTDARIRVARELKRVERAVTSDDHETIAKATPGVSIRRAHAAVGAHPLHPCRTVPGATTIVVVPDPGEGPARADAPAPDPGALEAVTAAVESARLVTAETFVRGPRYRPVAVRVELAHVPASPSEIERRIRAGLQTYLDPIEGGDDGDGWPFGSPLRPSALLNRLQELVGEDASVSSVAVGIDGAPATEDCAEVAIGPSDLLVLSRVDVAVGAAGPAAVGLR